MAQPGNDTPSKPKISDEFLSRLNQLGPKAKVRAIVMLKGAKPKGRSKRRMTPEQRREAIAAVQSTCTTGLGEIDEILRRFDGKRLGGAIDALGCISVETTAAGIEALAGAQSVKAVLEDQKIKSLPRPSRPR
ncbi:MAG: hypothetical protein IIB58_10400 [Planctomycetes bacterium]|nr:hypothetical protein [Planctomycetota bacterium]